MQFRTITGGGLRHVVSTAGQGPDVVLMHGFPDTPHTWEGYQQALADAGWRVTVPWLRGYRLETIEPGRGYDPETLGRDALALLDALDSPSAVLVGHDWGALKAYVAATLAPERVRAIATVAIPHPAVLKRTLANIWGARHFFALKLPWAPAVTRRENFAYFDRLYRRWSPNWSGPERDELLRQVKAALADDATLNGAIDYYRALPLTPQPLTARAPKLPGLVVGGTRDIIPASLFESTTALLGPGSRTVIVEGAGHWAHQEGADHVVPAMLEFLSGLDA